MGKTLHAAILPVTAMQTRKRFRGFSLIEVLFSVFLVVVCASIVAATMPVANNARARADMYNKALNLAQKQLETIRGRGYANATVDQIYSVGLIDSTTPIETNTYAFTNADSASLDEPSRILPHGTGKVLVEQADLDLRRIIVTVSWTVKGKTRSVQLGSLIANL
jgi:prepilin-type N-terminal cleavage/methylation domain-containing protein